MATRAREAEQRIEAARRNQAAVFAICNRFDLGRAERLEIATVLFDRNINSYKELSRPEWARLRDAFEGAVLVCSIQLERRRGERR